MTSAITNANKFKTQLLKCTILTYNHMHTYKTHSYLNLYMTVENKDINILQQVKSKA